MAWWTWFAAMLCILPFTWGRIRLAWAMLMLASLLAWAGVPWWLIDAGGALAFAHWPDVHSRAIAGLFAAMLLADFGATPWEVSMALGWCQWCILLVWSQARPNTLTASETAT